MKSTNKKNKKNNLDHIPVWEHLEWNVKNTSYDDRLLWLEEAHQFVNQVKESRASYGKPKQK